MLAFGGVVLVFDWLWSHGLISFWLQCFWCNQFFHTQLLSGLELFWEHVSKQIWFKKSTWPGWRCPALGAVPEPWHSCLPRGFSWLPTEEMEMFCRNCKNEIEGCDKNLPNLYREYVDLFKILKVPLEPFDCCTRLALTLGTTNDH